LVFKKGLKKWTSIAVAMLVFFWFGWGMNELSFGGVWARYGYRK
jgi:hypothetical protein